MFIEIIFSPLNMLTLKIMFYFHGMSFSPQGISLITYLAQSNNQRWYQLSNSTTPEVS